MKKLCFAVVLFSLIFLVSCSGSKSVDLMSFASVSFSGLEGKGKAILDINWSDFEKTVLTDKEQDDLAAFRKIALLEDSIVFSVDKAENLSNGDNVTISVKWDKEVAKEYKLSFSADPKKVTVEGLTIPKEIDLFQDISIEYSGISPHARVSVRNTSSEDFIKTVNFSVDNPTEIANGDVITVNASYISSAAERSGYSITKKSETYTVEGLDEYIAFYDLIDKDTFSKMEKQALDTIETALTDKNKAFRYFYTEKSMFDRNVGKFFDSLKVSSIELKNAYFFILKKGKFVIMDDANNSVFLVYEVQATSEVETEVKKAYIPVYYKNLILRADGVLDVNISNAIIPNSAGNDFDNMYRDIVTTNKEKYEYEEISF